MAGFAALLAMAAAGSAPAQQTPLRPPGTPPESRLTMTPSEFERWLGRTTASSGATNEPAAATPRLVSPPPPPVLVAPPPAPTLPLPAAPSTAPPPAPTLDAPAKPLSTATFPPKSDANSPSAAAAPAADAPPPDPVRILYSAEATDLPAAARPALDEIAAWLRDNPDVRIELLGYASESSKIGSQARRRALLRVLAVREYLVRQGVLSTRMTVRALGDQAADGPRDRAEVRLPPT